MIRHTPTGRRMLGLGLALFTASIWGTLPVVLKVLVKWLDVYTLTWFRFLAAGMLIAPLVMRRQGLSALFRIRGAPLALLGISVAGLCGNYLTYMSGLSFVSPGTAQVVIQLSPMFVLLGGLVIFGERFGRIQWLGFFILIAGLVLFFNPRYGDLSGAFGTYTGGILLVVVSAVLWATYMLSQKQLLSSMLPESVLFVIYSSGAVLLLPVVDIPQLAELSGMQMLLLLASSVMTVVSYFCFATALDHVEASRIGVVVALTPLITVMNMGLLTIVFPGVLAPEQLNSASMAGAVLVVVGSALGALGSAEI